MSLMDADQHFYNQAYSKPDHFAYRPWLYVPFLNAITRKAGIPTGGSILDAGCGQGALTEMLASLGFDVIGMDGSAVGIEAARNKYGHRCRFTVGDVFNPRREYLGVFEAVFARALSVYNVAGMPSAEVTEQLLTFLKPGGVLIWAYPLSQAPRHRSTRWQMHSWDEVTGHFSQFPGSSCRYSLRADTVVLDALGLSRVGSFVARIVNRIACIRSEAIVFVPTARC